MDKIFLHDIKILEKVTVKKKKKYITDFTILGTLVGVGVLIYIFVSKN